MVPRNCPTLIIEQIEVLYQKLDAQPFNQVWTAGRGLTMEQAIEFALGEHTG